LQILREVGGANET